MKTPCVIFDIDGTLADLQHRLHLVTGPVKDWPKFFDLCHADGVVEPTGIFLLALLSFDAGYTIVFVSGRPEQTRAATLEWFKKNLSYVPTELYMRKDGDHRQDAIVKKEILNRIRQYHDVLFVVDDRPEVIEMWREEGIFVFSCPWHGPAVRYKGGELHMMVGPSHGGKTYYREYLLVQDAVTQARDYAIVSSDLTRYYITGDEKDQTKNSQVFSFCHGAIKNALDHGLRVLFDATNIQTKDRIFVAKLAGGLPVFYHVLDRPLEDKLRDCRRGFPPEVIRRHHQTFQSNLKAILAGDNLPNVKVLDLRTGV